MVKKLLRIVSLTFIVSLAMTGLTFGQTGSYPFPQNVDYSFGLKPDNANASDVTAAYNHWKTNFITSTGACGYRRVIFDYFPGTQRGREDRSRTVSEGIAYGMLIAAYMDDKSLFDDLWSYYKIHRNQNGVMHWRIDNCSVSGQNGASDAELDVAMALIVASYQWQSDSYLNDAKNMIRVIRQHEFEGDILKPGDAFGGSNLVCPSYFSPAYYRVFADYDPGYETFWTNAASRGYQIINAADGSTGLVPDWCTAAGQASGDAGAYEDGGRNFIFDAIRTPFRSGLDFLWHGNADAKAYCERISNFITSQGAPSQIGSKYGTAVNGNEGQKLNNDHNNTFVGCFAVGLMGTELTGQQTYLNNIYSDNVNTNPNYGEYFNASFKVMSLLIMTGNFYLPPPDQCDSPDLGVDRSLCEGSPLTLNANVTPRNYVWRRNGNTLIGQNGQTLSVSQAGLYEVIATDASGCVRRDKVNVYDAALVADFQATPGPGSIFLTNTSLGGISNYTWTVTGDNLPSPLVFTEENPIPDNLANGSYDVELVIENSGFGCAQTDVITKTIIVGDGNGVAIDDFNDLYNNGINLYTYGGGGEFDAFPVTYCSRQAELDGDDPVCADHRCSYVDLVCNGATPATNWASMEFEFLASNPDFPLDLEGAAFVSVKMSATSPVQVGWRLGKTNVDGGFLSTAIPVDLTTEEQIFTLDFSGILDGDVDGTPSTITDWTDVTKLTLRPYMYDETFTGTISVDWVIVGSKSLSPPVIDTRKDEFGYIDYGNYLPNYYPNDPQYADCEETDVSGLCYGAVPDWEREIALCDGSDSTLVMNACTAETINWYKDGIFMSQGSAQTVNSPGVYLVEMINQGGITYDSVTVTVSETPEVDFLTSIEDDGYGLRVVPSYTNTDDWEWDFGIADAEMSEGPVAKTWEESYNNYNTDGAGDPGPGEGTYTVCLTAYNTACNLSAQECKEIEISCFSPLGAFDLSSTPNPIVESGDVDTIYTCNDTELTISTPAVDNAGAYGWFGQSAYASTTNELVAIISASEKLKVEAYNACGEKVVDSVYVKVEEEPIANFTVTDLGGNQYAFQADWVGASGTYSWDFGYATPAGSDIYIEHTFPDGGQYDVTLTITNNCGTDTYTETVGCDAPVVTAASISGPTTLCDGDGCQTYTLSGLTGATPTGYTWTTPVGATVCTETDDVISVNFDGTSGGTLSVTADVACGSSASVDLPITVNALPVISAGTATPAAACAGDDVELSVTGPGTATYAWSGPNAYSAATQTATISAAAVADAGTYSVTATENGCTSAAVDVDVVVNALPEQAVPSALPSAACEGEDIQLNASAVTGATYSWTGPNGFTSGVQNPMLSGVVAADGGTYSVTTTVGACSSLPADVVVTVNPTATLSGITGLTTVDCASTETYGVDPVNPSSSYLWTLPDNSTQPGSSTSIDWGANGGTLSVEETTSGGCTATTQVTITVNACPFPTPDFTADVTSGCGTLTVNFTDESATVDVGLDTYEWDFGDLSPTDATAGDVTHTYTAPGTYTVTLTITDDADGQTYSKSSTINVYEIPTLSNITAPFEICAGEAIDLSVTTDLGTVAWTGPSGYTGSTASVNVTNSAVTGNGGTYTAIATSNGCDSDPLTVDVTVNPAATVGSISGATAVDCGNTETYTVLPSVNGTSTYEWTLPNGSTQPGAPVDILWDETEGTLSVVETTAGGCTGSASATITITPCPNPAPNFSADATSGCGTLAVNFTDLSSAVGAGDTYTWDFGDATPTDNTVGGVSHTYTAPGTYTVSLTITDVSDANTTYTETKTAYITVNEIPSANTIVGNTLANCETQETYTITGLAGSTYVWDVSGMPTGVTGTSTTSSITVDIAAGTLGAGAISVVETSAAGCAGAPVTLDVNVNCTNFQAVIETPATDVTICEGDAVEFTGNVTGVTSNTPTFSWDFDGAAPASGLQNPGFVIFGTQGTYNVVLTVDDQVESNQATVVVTVVSSTVGAVGTIDGPTEVCDNQSGVTYSIAPVAGADTYTWTVPADAQVVTGQGSTSITVDFGVTAGNVEVTPSSSACGSVINGTPNSVAVNVGVGTVVPTITINGDGSTCDGNLSLTASTTFAGNTPQISWYVDNTLQNGQSGLTFTKATPYSGGEVVRVELISSDQCASPNNASDQVTVTLGQQQDITLSDITGNDLINECPAVTLQSYTVDPIPASYGPVRYSWSAGQGVVTDASGTPITPLQAGNQVYVDFSGYNGAAVLTLVQLTVRYQVCGVTKTQVAKPLYVSLCVPTSVEDELNGAELKVYPNPFASSSNVTVTSETSEDYELVIYSAVSGLTVYEGEHATNEVIEVGQDWTSGLYIGQAIFDGGVITFKIEKSR